MTLTTRHEWGTRCLLGNPLLNVGTYGGQVALNCAHSIFGFNVADDRDVVKGIVALTPHAVKECKVCVETGTKMLLSELNDCDMMAELHARPLTVAKHQGQGTLQHGLVGSLICGFLIDGEVFAGGGCLFYCVGQEQLYLFLVHPLRLCPRSGQSGRYAFRARYP